MRKLSPVLPMMLAALWLGCGGSKPVVSGGDAVRGAAAIYKYGCGSCHTIGGLTYAHGLVGPPLTGLHARMYVAGMLLNNQEHVESWVMHPHEVNPKTAMPELGVSQQDAADITAYLYTH